MTKLTSTSPPILEGVSVIICCYNGSSRLPMTLTHLATQRVPKSLKWEVLLIDNASTDGSASIAQKIWDELLPDSELFRIILEPKAGQHFARIRGAKEAQYDLLLFCDDDNWLDPDYIFFSTSVCALMSE